MTLQSEYARRRFREIVAVARAENPFYRRWIPDPENVPVLTRRTFADHNEEILAGRPSNAATSGSTGMPIRCIISAERARFNNEDTRRFQVWMGGPTPAVVLLRPRSKTPPPNVMDIGEPLETQFAFVRRMRETENVVTIITNPTHVVRLGDLMASERYDTSWVTRIVCMGEVLDDETRSRISQRFPEARIWNSYSSVEFGSIAAQCPYDADYLHIMGHKLGVEVLNENGEACPPGTIGRIVITDYFNRETPFIRYDLGDLGERGSCTCGKIPLPSFRRVHGKVFGTILKRSGERVVSYGLTFLLSGIADIVQFQIHQHDIEHFTVTVVSKQKVDRGVEDALASFLGYRPGRVVVRYVDTIPRGANGKFHIATSDA